MSHTRASAQIYTFDTTISNAAILTGNSSPVTLISAPGAGKFIHIVGPVVSKFNYVTAAFATNTTWRLLYGASPIDTFASQINQTFINIGVMNITDWVIGSTSVENAALRWDIQTGNPTGGGTSTLRIRFRYEILTL